MILFASNGLNIALTLGLLVIFIGLARFINKSMRKNIEEVKKGILLLYLVLFLVLVFFVGLSLWFFNMDLIQIIQDGIEGFVALIIENLSALVGSVVTIFVAAVLLKLIGILVIKASQKAGPAQKRVKTIMKLVKSISRYTIYLVVALIILALWGINVLPALAGLGILGLVVGLGAQSLIKDFISGFFIIFEHHFDVGDIIEVNGYKGEVVDIGLKTTKMKNWKQDIKIIANGSISELINYSNTQSVAIIEFGIAYKEDIQKTIDILNIELPKYMEKFPDILEVPVVLGVTELASSSVNIKVLIRTNTEKHYGVERGMRQVIKEILDKNNIEIPFPQVVVHKPVSE
ncbi:MAG: mechanosensitive ion channel family protein [Tenericutes bacterium]|nr:mechanosensitive ion channel family protein [Mycoplasmatota bacterium]